ncbi:MAG: hypothetical protein LIO68_01940 [Rikenellaceae bacterium]|nr:hypothetical protein [Rikenellaceae bacterium]
MARLLCNQITALSPAEKLSVNISRISGFRSCSYSRTVNGCPAMLGLEVWLIYIR